MKADKKLEEIKHQLFETYKAYCLFKGLHCSRAIDYTKDAERNAKFLEEYGYFLFFAKQALWEKTVLGLYAFFDTSNSNDDISYNRLIFELKQTCDQEKYQMICAEEYPINLKMKAREGVLKKIRKLRNKAYAHRTSNVEVKDQQITDIEDLFVDAKDIIDVLSRMMGDSSDYQLSLKDAEVEAKNVNRLLDHIHLGQEAFKRKEEIQLVSDLNYRR